MASVVSPTILVGLLVSAACGLVIGLYVGSLYRTVMSTIVIGYVASLSVSLLPIHLSILVVWGVVKGLYSAASWSFTAFHDALLVPDWAYYRGEHLGPKLIRVSGFFALVAGLVMVAAVTDITSKLMVLKDVGIAMSALITSYYSGVVFGRRVMVLAWRLFAGTNRPLYLMSISGGWVIKFLSYT